MSRNEKKILKRIKDRIKSKNPDADIILFGSHARGQSHEDSDWDILILLDQPVVTRQTEREYRDELFDIELEVGEHAVYFCFFQKRLGRNLSDYSSLSECKTGRDTFMINPEDYLNYRILKSSEVFYDATILAENNRWNSCMNRLYYSSFHLVSALLFKIGLKTHAHNGAKTQFNFHFIKTGKVSSSHGKLYSNLFSWRQESDYSDYLDFDTDTVLPLIKEVAEFNEVLIKLIRGN
jgi:uncharacterized protein (UPF0332 family)/predicted nucleotidyltransferase